MPQPVPRSQTPLEPAPLYTQPGHFGQVAGQLPGDAPARLGGLGHQANAGLVQNHHLGNRKVGCPICVSNPGVTLMPLVVEATDTHCRPEELGAQTTHPKKEKGNSNHGTEQDEPTSQMNEGRTNQRQNSDRRQGQEPTLN